MISKRTIARELAWLTLPVLLFLGLHGFDFILGSFNPSSAPWWRRLLLIEDACAYGGCIILPIAVYAISRPVGFLVEWRERRRTRRGDGQR